MAAGIRLVHQLVETQVQERKLDRRLARLLLLLATPYFGPMPRGVEE